jgi:hypothetical protein
MSSTPYSEAFPVGRRVRTAPRPELERFRDEWKHHNPLSVEQLNFAASEAIVREVGFYHGGDVLYVLDGIPGVWHEQCLVGL